MGEFYMPKQNPVFERWGHKMKYNTIPLVLLVKKRQKILVEI